MDISIHALREEGDTAYKYSCGSFPISIHALREEGDLREYEQWMPDMVISIHALREEGDAFLRDKDAVPGNFYPRPPRGGRLFLHGLWYNHFNISIHALREEGDTTRKRLRTPA